MRAMARWFTTFGLASLLPLSALAEPVVSPGGKPGAAKAWSTQDGALVLELVPGFTADAVAAAIQKGVAGAKASSKDGKVTVTGVEEKKLLVALEKVDVSADDVSVSISSNTKKRRAQLARRQGPGLKGPG